MSGLRRDLGSRAGLLMAGVVLLLSGALTGTVVLPALDPALDETTGGVREFGELELEGMRVYRSEGCWYCHTQQVRRTVTDAPLGDQLEPGDYEQQEPAMLGADRLGPDLTHVGSRYGGRGDDMRRLLSDPRGAGAAASKPSYVYLDTPQVDALVAYLLALR